MSGWQMPFDRAPRRYGPGLRGSAGRVLCLGLLLLGLLRSAVICLPRPPDADMASIPLIYEAVRQHGLTALAAWHYTQDNWLLSAILPELPIHALLGISPWLPAFAGWLFFVGSCAIVGLLARPAIGTTAALLFSAILLFASPNSLTGTGFLAHPTSHDVTTFWCLLALLPAMASLRGRSPALLLLSAGALLVATISDPWAKAAFLLPVLIGPLVAAVGLPDRRMRRVGVLMALTTLPSWLAGSHAFGLMPSLTNMHFDRGKLSGVPEHLQAGLIGLGTLFELGPSSGAAAIPSSAVAALLVLAGLFLVAVILLARRPDRLRGPDQVLALVCLLSTAATLAAFALSATPADIAFARLVLNSYFTLPLFLCLAMAGRRLTSSPLLLASGLAFAATGLFSGWHPVREHSVGAAGWQERLTAFLSAHDLHYGYGGYWGSDANSSRVRTLGAVTIRPVGSPGGGLLPIQPAGSQVFDDWYRAGDAEPGTPARFFVSVPDPDLCRDPRTCRMLAIRSFGEPERTLVWEGHEILVWPHPILFSMPDRAVLDALPGLEAAPSVGAALQPYLWTGWTLPDGDGSWMNGAHPVLMLPAAPSGSSLQCLHLRAASGPEGGPTQSLQLRDGAVIVARWQVPPGLSTEHCIPPHDAPVALLLEHGPEDEMHAAGILLGSISAKPAR